MPVRPPRRTDIDALVTALASPDPIDRDSASARLVVVGHRALGALRQLISNQEATVDARLAGLRSVAQIDAQEAIQLAGEVAASGQLPLALEATAILIQALTDRDPAATAELALERLTRLALEREALPECRQAAVDALRRLPIDVRRPLIEALKRDAAASAAATGPTTPSGDDAHIQADALLARWSEDASLPDADIVLEALEGGVTAPVTVLSRLLPRVRDQERSSDSGQAPGWAQVRDRLHETLANRGSSIALYDLREALETTDRSATAHLLAAAAAIADQSCLEAIALRWLAANRDAWLRDRLERIFRAIVVRERLRRQSAVLVRLLKRHPSVGALVATAPRSLKGQTTPKPQ